MLGLDKGETMTRGWRPSAVRSQAPVTAAARHLSQRQYCRVYKLSNIYVAVWPAECRPPPADCQILVTIVPSPALRRSHHTSLTDDRNFSPFLPPSCTAVLQYCSIAALQPGPVQLGGVVLPRTVDCVHCCDESCSSSSSFPRHNPSHRDFLISSRRTEMNR